MPHIMKKHWQPIGPWREYLIRRRHFWEQEFDVSEDRNREGCGPVDQVAKELGVDTRQVRRWMKTNDYADMFQVDAACCYFGDPGLARDLYPDWFSQDDGYEHIADLELVMA